MSYRPITDVWILARPKVKYYGAYPNGFLERAKALLGVNPGNTMLHVCGGRARRYPAWERLCPNDFTLDMNADLQPDFVSDVRESLPRNHGDDWDAILCDPPYTEDDARMYGTERAFPSANQLLRNALASVRFHGRVGMLHYLLPQPPKTAKFIACVGVIVGFNNRMRVYSVFERTA